MTCDNSDVAVGYEQKSYEVYTLFIKKNCNNAIFQSSDCSAYKATYCKIKKNHTLCKYCGTDTAKCNKVCSRGITSQADKDAIVKLHNKLRKKVARGEESRVQCVYSI